jgi:hypothetical protein
MEHFAHAMAPFLRIGMTQVGRESAGDQAIFAIEG